jgi:2-oxoisovalerate ferredoxin oxidoreductase beta subunit
VLSPAAPEPHVLVAFNAPSLAKFGPKVPEAGIVLYDQSVIAEPPTLRPGVRMVGVPFTKVATDLGKSIVKNIVALGALQEATRLFPPETFLTAIRQALADKSALVPLNERAFALGTEHASAASGGPA